MSPSDVRNPAHSEFERGTVWLVGAGPGDPGRLTLLALDALRQADVIVYDALVLPEMLEFATPEAQLEFAGKRAGTPSPQQQDITDRLIQLAREGRRVLRLKGGDPFVFGRGGEEAKALAEAGIRFRVVPGVTAGIGGLAYAGIPATMRDANQALFFATGHPAAEGEDHVDWEGIARIGQPVVIYMGLTRLHAIVTRLLAGGLDRNTPLAILSKATLPDQYVFETTLGEVLGTMERAAIESPALIVIGSIVCLRQILSPYQILY